MHEMTIKNSQDGIVLNSYFKFSKKFNNTFLYFGFVHVNLKNNTIISYFERNPVCFNAIF